MKFLKQSQLNFRNVKDQSVSVGLDGSLDGAGSLTTGPRPRIIMENSNSLKLPKGTTVERPDPAVLENGMIRYNTSTDELEARQATAWRKIAFKEPTLITQQNLGNGDAAEIYFGPLDSGNADYPYPEITKPQNIMVYVENVFQISTTNYILTDNPATNISGSTNNGFPTLTSSQAHPSMVGAEVVGTGIPASTFVLSVIQGVSLTLSENATATGSDTFAINRVGRFVEFTSSVPYGKPVTVLHGFDR